MKKKTTKKRTIKKNPKQKISSYTFVTKKSNKYKRNPKENFLPSLKRLVGKTVEIQFHCEKDDWYVFGGAIKGTLKEKLSDEMFEIIGKDSTITFNIKYVNVVFANTIILNDESYN